MKYPTTLLLLLLFLSSVYTQDCQEFEPSGEDCATAPFICGLENYCSDNFGADANGTPNSFCGIVERDVWIGFRAGSEVLELEVVLDDCPGGGSMQGVIFFTNECTQNTPVSNCNSGSTSAFVLTASDLIIGEIYHIMLDGTFGDECSFSFNILNGSTLTPEWANAGESGTICGNEPVVLTGSNSNNAPTTEVSWFTDDGNIVSGANTLTPTIDATGTYGLIVNDPIQGCADTSFATFNIAGNIFLEIPLPDTLNCLDNEFITLSAMLIGTTDVYNFVWQNEAEETIANTQNAEVNTVGIYTVFADNGTGECSLSATVEVFRFGLEIIAVIDPPEELNCLRDTVLLNGYNSQPLDGLIPSWTYLDLSTNSFTTVEGWQFLATSASIYTFTVLDPVSGCNSEETIILNENEAEPTGVSTTLLSDCDSEASNSIQIEEVFNGNPPYTFSFDDADFSEGRNFIDLAPGSYPLTVRDSIGCTFDTTLLVPVQELIFLDLGEDFEIKLGEETQLQPFVNNPNFTFNWLTDNDFLSCNDCLNPIVKPLNSDSYILQVENAVGCQVSDTLQINVIKKYALFVPNAFSPNDDGINDRLIPFACPAVSRILNFQVFDRWGNLVFRQTNFAPNDLSAGFDGTYRNKQLNNGTFVWTAEAEYIDGVTAFFKGSVLLLK